MLFFFFKVAKSGKSALLINVILNQRSANTMIDDHHTEKTTGIK